MRPSVIGIAQQLAAQLLRFPTVALDRQLGHIAEIASMLPGEIGPPLATLADHLRAGGMVGSVEEYMATFAPGGCLLFLSVSDDPAFTLAYRRAGFRLADNERADFLPAVLEFAAARVAAEDFCGQELLCGYRPALDEIAGALAEIDSPYLLAVDAVGATLPVLHPAG